MKIKISIAVVILFALLICSASCNKSCPEAGIYFDLPVEIDGIADTLHVGDTLRIKLEFSDNLKERYSLDNYRFQNYDFKLISYIVKLDENPALPATESCFDWVTLQGSSNYAQDVNFLTPAYQNGTYSLEQSIILQKPGLFQYGMNSDFSRLFPLAAPEGKCKNKSGVNVLMKIQNGIDQNFDFLQQSSDTIYLHTDRRRFDEYAGFCFYVK